MDNNFQELFRTALGYSASTVENMQYVKCYSSKTKELKEKITKIQEDIKTDKKRLEELNRLAEQNQFYYEQDLEAYATLTSVNDKATAFYELEFKQFEIQKSLQNEQLKTISKYEEQYKITLQTTDPNYKKLHLAELELKRITTGNFVLQQKIAGQKRINQQRVDIETRKHQQEIVNFAEFCLKNQWIERVKQAHIENEAAKKRLVEAQAAFEKKKSLQYLKRISNQSRNTFSLTDDGLFKIPKDLNLPIRNKPAIQPVAIFKNDRKKVTLIEKPEEKMELVTKTPITIEPEINNPVKPLPQFTTTIKDIEMKLQISESEAQKKLNAQEDLNEIKRVSQTQFSQDVGVTSTQNSFIYKSFNYPNNNFSSSFQGSQDDFKLDEEMNSFVNTYLNSQSFNASFENLHYGLDNECDEDLFNLSLDFTE